MRVEMVLASLRLYSSCVPVTLRRVADLADVDEWTFCTDKVRTESDWTGDQIKSYVSLEA